MPDAHEHRFVEEQEPEGRLILAPCLICGLSAMDAMDQLREERDKLQENALTLIGLHDRAIAFGKQLHSDLLYERDRADKAEDLRDFFKAALDRAGLLIPQEDVPGAGWS